MVALLARNLGMLVRIERITRQQGRKQTVFAEKAGHYVWVPAMAYFVAYRIIDRIPIPE